MDTAIILTDLDTLDPTPMAPSATVADALAAVLARGHAPQTYMEYRRDIDHFLTCIGAGVTLPLTDLPTMLSLLQQDTDLRARVNATLPTLCRVTAAVVRLYLDLLERPDGRSDRSRRKPRREDGGLAAGTITRRLTPIRLLFRRLQRHGLLRYNPLDDLRTPQADEDTHPIYLSYAEWQHLDQSLHGPTLRDMRDRALFACMVRTGLRAREVLGMTVEALTQVDAVWTVTVQVKGGRHRRIKLPTDVKQCIDHYLEAAEISTGPIWRRVRPVGPKGGGASGVQGYRVYEHLHYAGLYKILQERVRAAGLSQAFRPHATRHTFAVLAWKGGAATDQIQEQLGHRDIRTTQGYLHETNTLEQNAVDYVGQHAGSSEEHLIDAVLQLREAGLDPQQIKELVRAQRPQR